MTVYVEENEALPAAAEPTTTSTFERQQLLSHKAIDRWYATCVDRRYATCMPIGNAVSNRADQLINFIKSWLCAHLFNQHWEVLRHSFLGECLCKPSTDSLPLVLIISGQHGKRGRLGT